MACSIVIGKWGDEIQPWFGGIFETEEEALDHWDSYIRDVTPFNLNIPEFVCVRVFKVDSNYNIIPVA